MGKMNIYVDKVCRKKKAGKGRGGGAFIDVIL